MPTTVTPPHPDWKQDDGPEGPDELELTAEDLIVTGSYLTQIEKSLISKLKRASQGGFK